MTSAQTMPDGAARRATVTGALAARRRARPLSGRAYCVPLVLELQPRPIKALDAQTW